MIKNVESRNSEVHEPCVLSERQLMSGESQRQAGPSLDCLV